VFCCGLCVGQDVLVLKVIGDAAARQSVTPNTVIIRVNLYDDPLLRSEIDRFGSHSGSSSLL
jgi:hypothetical protein